MLKTLIVGTHNLCFGSELRKKGILLHPPLHFFDKKVGFKGVNISRSCFPDVKRRGGGGVGSNDRLHTTIDIG